MGKNLYIRADSDNGVLTNEEDIAYYKATQDVEIISNYLLGDFNEDGEYIISQDIIEELVEIPKGITNEFSNMFFCVSHVITEYVETEKFVIKTRYDDDDPSIKISTLEVLEDIKKVDGYIVNSLSTPIAEFVDIISDNYKEKMFDAFNIIDKDQLSTSQLDKFAHGQISLRRKFVASIEKICNPQLEEAHKEAYLKKLEILKKSGKVGEDTIKLFEDRLKNKPVIATKNNYKALNELLDSVIEVHKEQLKPVMPQIRKVGVEFSEKIEQIKKLSFQNLKNIQKTPMAIKAIQTQQDAMFNNKLAKVPPIKEIQTQEVKKLNYERKEQKYNIYNKNEQPKEEQPKEQKARSILSRIFNRPEKTEKKDDSIKKSDDKKTDLKQEKKKTDLKQEENKTDNKNKSESTKETAKNNNFENPKNQPDKKTNVSVLNSDKQNENANLQKQFSNQKDIDNYEFLGNKNEQNLSKDSKEIQSKGDKLDKNLSNEDIIERIREQKNKDFEKREKDSVTTQKEKIVNKNLEPNKHNQEELNKNKKDDSYQSDMDELLKTLKEINISAGFESKENKEPNLNGSEEYKGSGEINLGDDSNVVNVLKLQDILGDINTLAQTYDKSQNSNLDNDTPKPNLDNHTPKLEEQEDENSLG